MTIEVLQKLSRGIPQIKAGALQLGLAALIFAAGATGAYAAPVFAEWTDISDTTVTGTLNGVGFTMQNVTGAAFIVYNLTGSDYSAAPGANDQTALMYSDVSDWTITFDSPIEVLYLHLVFWRPDTYVFSASLTSVSGNTTATIGSDSLQQASNFANGILKFENITSFSVSPASGGGVGAMALTFATDEAPVPEPGSLALLGAGCCAIFALKRKAA